MRRKKRFIRYLIVIFAAAYSLGALGGEVISTNAPVPGVPQDSYTLGPDDAVLVSVLQAPEIGDNKPLRIDLDGNISLPYVGQMLAAGRTVSQLRSDLVGRLRSIIKNPQVVVSVVEFNSQPVSVLGAVNSPGVHQLRGQRSLTEMLSAAGGLRQDAGATISITRRCEEGKIPLSSASKDSTGNFYIASIGLKDVLEGRRPENNIPIKTNDVISVTVAEMVYVMGNIAKPGGYVLGERPRISITEAVALAGGVNQTGDSQHCRILRRVTTVRNSDETIINLKKILQGKAPDFQLQANDLVFVPSSTTKAATLRAIEAAIQVGSGMAIWSTPR